MLKRFATLIASGLMVVGMALPSLATPGVTSAVFSADGRSVTATSDKNLSNVVLGFCDETGQKFDNLSGYTRTFSGTGANQGKQLMGVWIKSGNNQSGDGPGYGEWHGRTGACGVVIPPDDPPGGEDEVCLVIDGELVCFPVEDPGDFIPF